MPKIAPKRQSKDPNCADDASSAGSLDVGACCLCHCALDYSDRAAFFRDDRHEDYHEDSDQEEYFFRKSDPYLPNTLYDPSNALVYCDSCDRMYHQKCHFVPLTVVPRGKWDCLVCQTQREKAKISLKKKKPATGNDHSKRKTPATSQDHAIPRLSSSCFQSPPNPGVREEEVAWESACRDVKAALWKAELHNRVPLQVNSQLANVRLAETALETLTSTAKNRSHFAQNSQELAQCMVRLYGSRRKLRHVLLNLQDLIRGDQEMRWNMLLRFCRDDASPEFVARVAFPFGMSHSRRVDPRTPEMTLNAEEHASNTVPAEISLTINSETQANSEPAQSITDQSKPIAKHDGDSGISLDNLRCCVCHQSDATDENDMIMCDGCGCYRAYHMRCLQPHVKPEEVENEEDDWFCPLCSTLADMMLLIQTNHMGDEWEQRRYAAELDGVKNGDDDSLKSWNAVEEVFPEVEVNYAAACDLKDGKRTTAASKLLGRILGLEEQEIDTDIDDDEEDEDDGHFDLESFQEKRHQARVELSGDKEDASEGSSQATLEEMSSVELNIGKDELAALSEVSEDEEESEQEVQRRSVRLRKSGNTSSANASVSDPGKLDESNILNGKRGRKSVDYQKLNDAIFGELSDGEIAKIDDTDDFLVATSRNQNDSSDSGDANDDSTGSSHVGEADELSLDDESEDSESENTENGIKDRRDDRREDDHLTVRSSRVNRPSTVRQLQSALAGEEGCTSVILSRSENVKKRKLKETAIPESQTNAQGAGAETASSDEASRSRKNRRGKFAKAALTMVSKLVQVAPSLEK